MLDIVTSLGALYSVENVKDYKMFDSSRGEADKRFTYLLWFDNGSSLAIKVSNNTFTSPERISGWSKTCKMYLDSGIYCPQIVGNLAGSLYSYIFIDGGKFIVYAEETKKFKCVDEFENLPDKSNYKDGALETIGIIASREQELVVWPTAFCLYDKFDENDRSDENYDCAVKFCSLIT